MRESADTFQSTLLLQKQQELSRTEQEYSEAIERFKLKQKNLREREAILRDRRKQVFIK